jgi:hypothetical protein
MRLAQGAVDAAAEKPRIIEIGDYDRHRDVPCGVVHSMNLAVFFGIAVIRPSNEV